MGEVHTKHKKLFVVAVAKESIAILSLLKVEGKLRYQDIMQRLGLTKKQSGYLGYYIRNLKLFGLIVADRNKEYETTERGLQFLKFFHKFDEKFLADDQENLCHNTENGSNHVWYKVCRNCSKVDKNGNE